MQLKIRRGGTVALMEPVASDSAVASDIAVFGFSVSGGHDSEIGIPGKGLQGGKREKERELVFRESRRERGEEGTRR